MVKEDIQLSRSRLLAQIESWNARAQMQGLHSQQIHVGDPGASAIQQVATHASATSSSSSSVTKSHALVGSSASCSCEKAPADKRWPMRPAAEIEAETPELAAALRKAAKDNEVMIALGVTDGSLCSSV